MSDLQKLLVFRNRRSYQRCRGIGSSRMAIGSAPFLPSVPTRAATSRSDL